MIFLSSLLFKDIKGNNNCEIQPSTIINSYLCWI